MTDHDLLTTTKDRAGNHCRTNIVGHVSNVPGTMESCPTCPKPRSTASERVSRHGHRRRQCTPLGMIVLSLILSENSRGEYKPPARVAVPLPNAGFEEADDAAWGPVGDESGDLRRDNQMAHSGRASARAGATRGEAGFFLDRKRLIPVRAGETLKLAAWVKTDGATGNSYLSLDGYADGNYVRMLGQSKGSMGTTPGWVYRWAVATVPEDGGISHVRPALRSENNSGAAWFDDVRLWRLPPDEPVTTGPPPAPPSGQITSDEGHLVGSDGHRVRFWGVNAVDEPGRTYREITHIARRIRRMGFNAVRLHLYDIRFIDTDAKNESGEKTSVVFQKAARGDGSLLDKLDYFIYCCERESLYLYLTFDRQRVKFAPGDYDVLPSGGSEDERAWKEALEQLQPSGADEHAYFVDPRLTEAQARYVRQLLDHRNAYTGTRVADDRYVALYELTNENHFPEWMLRGEFRKWPDYFQQVLQERWNRWLREQYVDDQKLRAAWGQLGQGESISNAAVELAPSLDQAKDHPPKRLADVHRFVYDLFTGYSQRLERIIRNAGSSSAKTPISWDTLHEHKHKWYYPCSQADLVTVGTYTHGGVDPDRETCILTRPPQALYNLSHASMLGKPMVVYETNTLKPDWWRAVYPMWIAAFAATHDWDGIFWYTWGNGTVPDQFDDDTYAATGLRYASVDHQWHGIVISTDEVLLASLRVAGEIFRGCHVPRNADPVIVTIGARDLLGPNLWVGNIDVPYPEDAPLPWKCAFALAATDFHHTVRYRFDMDRDESSVSRPLIPKVTQPCSPVSGLTYDWQRGLMIVDTPTAKAAVGFVDKAISFGDEIEITEITGIDPRFVCFAFVSTDGRPLREARHAILVLTSYGENRGRIVRPDLDAVSANVSRFAKLIQSWGVASPDIARPSATIQLGGGWNWQAFDFTLQPIAEGKEQETLHLPAGAPIYRVQLDRDDSR